MSTPWLTTMILYNHHIVLNIDGYWKDESDAKQCKWAATWQHQQSECAPSEESDQPGHPPSLIRDIHPVWSESSLSACRKLGSLATHWAHSEDSNQTGDALAGLSLPWAHSHFVGFVMSWLKCLPERDKDKRSEARIIGDCQVPGICHPKWRIQTRESFPTCPANSNSN